MVAKKRTAKKTAAKKTAAKKTTAVAKVSGGWWGNTFSVSTALIALVSALGIASLFFGWLTFLNNDFPIQFQFNGLDLLMIGSEGRKDIFNNSWQLMIPFITFILSIITLVAVFLPAFKLKVNRTAVGFLSVIIGLVMFILVICFLFGSFTGIEDKFFDHFGIGFTFTLVTSIVLMIAGLAEAIKSAF